MNKTIIGGFIIEVFLFIATGFAYAYKSLLWILFLVLGLGWAYRVGEWIEQNSREKEGDYAERLLREIKEKRERDKIEGEKLLEKLSRK